MSGRRARAERQLVRATTPDVALVTIPSVELLEVGDDWATSTGVFSFTFEDLQSAIASQDDPGVRTPVVKLGHTDPRFDGQPSFGRIQNLALSANGQTLLGDLVGVPAWLAKVMPTAFPRRSIEGWFAETTRTGNQWPFVLTGVALLGDAYPAIDTLEDLDTLWGEVAPPLVPVADVPEVVASSGALIRATRVEDEMPTWTEGGPPVAAADGAATEGGTVPRQALASVSVEDVRRGYYETLDSNQYWWWIRAVLLDPTELIVDDDEGQLYRVPYTVSGDTITFGEAAEVKIEYVDVAASAGVAPVHAPKIPVAPSQKIAASWATPGAAGRPKVAATESPAASPEASGTVPETTSGSTTKETRMTDEQRATLRAAHKLPETATDEEILEAVTAAAQAAAQAAVDAPGDGETGGTDAPASTPGTTDTPGTSQPDTPATDPAGSPAPAPDTSPSTGGNPSPVQTPTTPQQAVPDGMALIDTATLEELRQGATAANELVAAQRTASRNALLDGAIKAGKFPRARRAHYEALLSADPEGTAQIINSLAEGVVPVTERGVGTEVDASAEQYPESWKPSVSASRRSAGARVKVVSD